jgi:hypothetical protein
VLPSQVLAEDAELLRMLDVLDVSGFDWGGGEPE